STGKEAAMSGRDVFSFPNPVNELSARLVAGGVVTMAVAAIVFGQFWLLIPLGYGFVARVLTGPTLSPLGSLVTKVITPRLPLPAKYVPGPPKRARARDRRDVHGRSGGRVLRVREL